MVAEADESDGSLPAPAPVHRRGHQHRPRAPGPLRHARQRSRTPSRTSATACPSTASTCCAWTTPTCRRSCRAWRSASSPTAARTWRTTGWRASGWRASPRASRPSGATSRSASSACAWWARTTPSTRWPSSPSPRRWTSRWTRCAARWPSSAACSGASPCAVRRRGVTVVDDYGHHPTEVQATLAGARRAFGRRIVVAFQPHRYTRTRDLLTEFATAFNDADVALRHRRLRRRRGAASPAPPASALAEAVRAHGHRDVTFVEKRTDLAQGAAAPAARGRHRPHPGRRRHHPGGPRAARAAQAARHGEGRLRAMAAGSSSSLAERLGRLSGVDVTAGAPLAPLTSVRVGGPAEALRPPALPGRPGGAAPLPARGGRPAHRARRGRQHPGGRRRHPRRHAEAAERLVPRAVERGRGGGGGSPSARARPSSGCATRCVRTGWSARSSSRAFPAPWAAPSP